MLESYFRIENWFCPDKKKEKGIYIYGTLVLIKFVCRSLKWNRLKCWNISTADIEVKFWKHWAMGQEFCVQTYLNHGWFLRYIYLPKLKNIQLFHLSTSLYIPELLFMLIWRVKNTFWKEGVRVVKQQFLVYSGTVR